MNRPHVTINCAMSCDGKIALPGRKPLKISCREDAERVRALRNGCDAILVGVGTVLSDDPGLNAEQRPVRVVLDSQCRTPENARVVDAAAKTLIITSEESGGKYGGNVELVQCPGGEGLLDLEEVLEALYSRHGIKKLLVEGGGTVIWGFVRHGLVDDLYAYIAPMVVGGKDTPTMADGEGTKGEPIPLEVIETSRLGPGILVHYRLR
ncbi:MAG: 2,5-diamino-6-(ribosylamino)-4(3H)-pyrimidinone 5'-phosphate reductase [Candidatus Diapherotrites archaeon]|nr:2,5-diamino-6-(ribosylamino)-4(3H)-pyrimidinone 5'-phosphate reductase [Candidatus Diapherotrites archaeon]